MKKPSYLIHSEEYGNWIFDHSHPTQGRRFINAHNQFSELLRMDEISHTEVKPRLASRAELERVHDSSYVNSIIDEHESSEWDGQREDLSRLATIFVGGTLIALEALISKATLTAIHFPGSKHHAQRDHSSGFCVFNDFAIAADIATKDYGLRVAILDIDAHHGDGVENLTVDNPDIITFSIHEGGIFPGTGFTNKDGSVYNVPLNNNAGDRELLEGVSSFIEMLNSQDRINDWRPDLLFITCGADGHLEDPLSSLTYTLDGYIEVAKKLREHFPELPFLMGGAGGYLPDTRTPEIWARFAHKLLVVS